MCSCDFKVVVLEMRTDQLLLHDEEKQPVSGVTMPLVV